MADSAPPLTPPQAPPSWTHTPAALLAATKDAIAASRTLHDRIAALPPASCSVSSVIRPLAAAAAVLTATTEPLSFYKNVAPDRALRDASNEAEGLLREFNVDASMRVDVFEAVRAVADAAEKSAEPLDAEEKRLIEKMLLDGKRAGLALPEAERKELLELRKELSQVCLEFSKNFNEEKGTIEFTLDELAGLPTDVLSGYKKVSAPGETPERYAVTFRTPDIIPVFNFASNSTTRRRAYLAYETRLAHNTPLLSRGLALRRRCARILGYPTWADYVVEVGVAGTANRVFEFLNDVVAKLKPVGMKERDRLLKLKEEEYRKQGLPFDGEFYIWDYRYYDRKYTELTLDLDDGLVKEYFPVARVVPAVLQIYQDLLGVEFRTIEGEVWHPEVEKFAVWEKGATDASGFLGYAYLDLFPRDDKYSHAAVWPLIPGYAADTPPTRIYPVAAMVANLAKATPEHPDALMRHDDVVTFFHEMGHIFHELLSRVRFSRFHGTTGAMDFIEAPSQMLENWCWDPSVLRKMSSHFKTGQPLPDDLIERLVKSRYANVGLFYLRQGFFALFDMKVHTDQEEQDYTALWNNLREPITLLKNDPDAPHAASPGSLMHIMGGYDAAYYGYMYSLVFAADMWATVFEGNALDPKLGKLYRDTVLLPGSSKDELVFLKEFLGREPNSDAFLKALFGTVPKTNL